jgi:hypothetical protein
MSGNLVQYYKQRVLAKYKERRFISWYKKTVERGKVSLSAHFCVYRQWSLGLNRGWIWARGESCICIIKQSGRSSSYFGFFEGFWSSCYHFHPWGEQSGSHKMITTLPRVIIIIDNYPLIFGGCVVICKALLFLSLGVVLVSHCKYVIHQLLSWNPRWLRWET